MSATKYTTPTKKKASQRPTWPIVAGIVAAVVAAAVVVAIVASSGGGEDDDVNAAGEPVLQMRPVQVTGDPLPSDPTDTGAADEAIGLPAPALSGRNFVGDPISIEPGGSAKMVVFVAHWCPHCQVEVPLLVDMAADGLFPEDLEVYAVSTGVDESAPNYPPSAWLDEEGWPFPVLVDSGGRAASEAYGLTGYPFFVLVGEDGNVKARASGELGQDQILSIIDAALAS